MLTKRGKPTAKESRQAYLRRMSTAIDVARKQGMTIISGTHTGYPPKQRVINVSPNGWGGGFWSVEVKGSIHMKSPQRGVTKVYLSNGHGEHFTRIGDVHVDEKGYARIYITHNKKKVNMLSLCGFSSDRPSFRVMNGVFYPV